MKKFFCMVALCLLFSVNQAQAGILYNNTITPLLATDMPTENVRKLKCGQCQISHIFGLIDTGEAGIQNAARRAEITRIHHIDVQTTTILGIGMTTVRVYGE